MLRDLVTDVLGEAAGRRRRLDPVTSSSTGGPAGNALLTAWTGLILLVLFLVELATLLDLSRWIDWHIVVGVLLIPPALLKTASTGWRIVRYYRGEPAYAQAGPPPLLLRLLGPLVVLATLALLGSGLLLVALGPQTGRQPLVTALNHPFSAVTLHAGLAVVWAAVTGVHVLARLAAALTIVAGSRGRGAHGRRRPQVPGSGLRVVAIALTLACAVVAIPLVGRFDSGWTQGPFRSPHHDREGSAGATSGR